MGGGGDRHRLLGGGEKKRTGHVYNVMEQLVGRMGKSPNLQWFGGRGGWEKNNNNGVNNEERRERDGDKRIIEKNERKNLAPANQRLQAGMWGT